MQTEQALESILIADCGTVATKMLLLERVETRYRFIAQVEVLTTINPPWEDVSVGVTHAIEEVEQITSRTLLSGGRLITPRDGLSGVDAFVVILSGVEPLHLVLAGLVKEMSLESARRAATGTYTVVDGVISREGSLHSPEGAWARAIRDLAPDAVLLVGGVDGGASRPVMELADAIALGTSLLGSEERPLLLYAGNAKLRSRITKLLGGLTEVEVVDNVRPSVDKEYLAPARDLIEQIFLEKRLQKVPGVETLSGWSNFPLLSTAAAFGRVVEYLWHREDNTNRGVLGIDLGAANTTVMACFDGRLYPTVHGGCGIAYGPLAWVKKYGLARLQRWLPEEISAEQLLSFLYNRELHPATVPQELSELWIELAVVREMLRTALRIARPVWNVGADISLYGDMMPYLDPILISGGGIVHLPRPGQALLAVLDGLEPVGITTMLLDVHRVAPALGAVAGIKPLAAASALSPDTLVSLGTVISPIGHASDGDTILSMKIQYDDGSELDVEAHYGELEVWPLLPGQQATVELQPHRRFDVGLGRRGKGGTIQVQGGLLGLVVDARGRPLRLPADGEKRRKLLRRWIWDVGG
ncbi:MAG TPA: hypothetical protein G4N98_06385 [Thermoflexia bacterium]|nr:hypothetical protein [Thermoflexia bacterium]